MAFLSHLIQYLGSLKPLLIYRAQHILGTGLGPNEYTVKAAIAQQSHVFIARRDQEIGRRLNTPVEFQSGSDKPTRNIDSPLAVDQEVVVHDVDQIQSEAAHQLHDLGDDAVRREGHSKRGRRCWRSNKTSNRRGTRGSMCSRPTGAGTGLHRVRGPPGDMPLPGVR